MVLKYPKALAWSYDQSQAYMVSYAEPVINVAEYLTIFEDPYDILRPFGTPSPKTIRIDMPNPFNYIAFKTNGIIGLPD